MPNRIFPFQKTYNLRELGGYPTEMGRQLRWHKLLRAGYLSELTKDEQNFLTDYGLRYCVDLRSDYERQNWPDPAVDSWHNYHWPLYPGDGSGERQYHQLPAAIQGVGLAQMYQAVVLDQHCQRVFQAFFQLLLTNDQPEKVVLFHCSAGKDRTGILAILFLFVLKVPLAVITRDYLLTNLMYQQNSDLRGLRNSADAQLEQINLTPADQATIAAVEKALLSVYGSWNQFRQQVLKLTPADYQHLIELYTEPQTRRS
ncbi:tyrosine-protein phosphatase [Lactobacillus sp. DCY120]|uniref:Tyrosine-protein phosphatase n=1 Tax=Bombilactobacillus apium TaxID=2675299 RepID=A0A850R7D9_9LACO|nr:tyrosine-protein phosphatase [Bombilactobacillus apium]NVY96445.1 tyrosine-protein phosphatase [Bombilactobacillus apium]